MKPVYFHPEAEAEAVGAFEWYWERSQSIALRFDAELRQAYSALASAPAMGAPYIRGTRRVLLHRYPFFVVFRERPRKIDVIAVVHAKRRPGYWKGRS